MKKRAYQVTLTLCIMHIHNLCRKENGTLLRALVSALIQCNTERGLEPTWLISVTFVSVMRASVVQTFPFMHCPLLYILTSPLLCESRIYSFSWITPSSGSYIA